MSGLPLVAAEVLVENFSGEALLVPPSGSFQDDLGVKYGDLYQSQGLCQPAIAGEYDTRSIPPGGSARGFLLPVEVAKSAKGLALLYRVGSSPGTEHRMPLGVLPSVGSTSRWEPGGDAEVSRAGVRMKVTAVQTCDSGEAGKHWVGVEVLLENTSATSELIGNSTAILEDASHYRHPTSRMGTITECTPDLGNPFTLEPGQKIRGWLWLFEMALGSGPWTLHYDLSVGDKLQPLKWPKSEMIDIPLGKLVPTR